MTLSEELQWRGFVNQTTLKDLSALDKKAGKFYHGYDASADSLTVGNLAAVMLDKCFSRHGWQAVLLAGGATSLIGDPGGKDEERPLQDEATITKNVAAVQKQIEQLSGGQTEIINNLDWFKDMTVLEFLRDVGKHFSMTPLVQRDYIATRMHEGGSGITYTEFSYTLLQGYDYLHLFREEGVTLQLAGSDQWGNCLSGVDLVRRVEGQEVHALTMPLIISSVTGKKFGKSEGGAVWLDPAKTSPEQFYQFWVNVDDAGVEGYLKIFTELDKSKIDQIMTDFAQDKPARLAQKTLAYEATKLVHGEAAAAKAQAHAKAIKSAPAQQTATIKVNVGADIAETLVAGGLASSKSEARQLLQAGGIYINDQKAEHGQFTAGDFKDGSLALRRGKTLQNTIYVGLE